MSIFDEIVINRKLEDDTIITKSINLSLLREYNNNSKPEDLLGQVGLLKINGYQFKNFLGGGQAAMTALYENEKNEKCVFKFLFSPRNNDEYQNFVSEYGSLLKLEYTKIKYIATPKIIVKFTQVNKFPVYYFGIEYINGTTLKEIIENDPLPWEWKKAMNIAQRISLALYEVNMNRIIHRDLHPGNIIILNDQDGCTINKKYKIDEEDSFVRIVDFGNKVNWGGELFGDIYNGDAFRFEGAITSWSPEYVLDRERTNDIAQDIWSLGVITFYLLTGKYPINVSSISDMLKKYRHLHIHIDYHLLSNTPHSLYYIIKRMLESNPDQRIGTGPLSGALSEIVHTDLLNEKEEDVIYRLKNFGNLGDPLEDIY